MFRRLTAVASTAILILFLPAASGFAAVKAGTTCSKAGQSTSDSGKKFVCTKTGKKLTWILKKIPVKVSQESPGTTPVVPPAVDLTAECKLPNGSGARPDVAIGWPRIASRMNTVGVLNVKVIMVDFSDAVTTRTPAQAFSLINPKSAEIFTEMSYGRTTYKFDPALKWYRMSQPSTAYTFHTFDGQKSYIQEAVQLASGEVDFSKTDSLIVLANPDATHFDNGPAFAPLAGSGITIKGNYIGNGATSGHDLNNFGAIWLNHEISHSMGLVDLYAFNWDAKNYDSVFRFTGDFSYMSNSILTSNSPGLLAWERWLLGWLDDSQIICQKSGEKTITLSPIESSGGVKAVMIPTGKYTGVLIESRRALGIDKNMVKQGVLVYTIDTSVGSGYGPIQVQNVQPNDPRLRLSPLASGESLTVGNVKISVTASDSAGDTVNVSVRS